MNKTVFHSLLLALLLLCVLALALALLIPGLGGGGAAPSGPTDGGAIVSCEKSVTNSLKSPVSASFPPDQLHVVPQGSGLYDVVGAVDAKNSFGTTIRTRFACVIQYNSGSASWKLISLDFPE
jgi:hypothetical protein